jgi:ribosomal protein S18 acetylase RimI-like enzyme
VFTVRKAVLKDAADMAEIITCSWEAAYSGIIPPEAIAQKNAGRLALWQRVLREEHGNYIALCDGVPAGLMTLMPSRDSDLPGTGEIGSLYLHPAFFGRGLGRFMIGAALAIFNRNGFREAGLWVLEDNARARRFYEKCGFTRDGSSKDVYIGKPLAEIRYRIKIIQIRKTCR